MSGPDPVRDQCFLPGSDLLLCLRVLQVCFPANSRRSLRASCLQKEEEPKHFEIIEKIKKIETYFNEIDEYFDNISSYQSQNDEYISDLLHYMEVNEFTQASALKFVKLLKEKRIRRRTLNNDWEIKRVFDSGRQRFSAGTDQREMFMASLYKKEKELSYPYNPRQVNFDEIDQLIAVKRGRKSKKDDELIGV